MTQTRMLFMWIKTAQRNTLERDKSLVSRAVWLSVHVNLHVCVCVCVCVVLGGGGGGGHGPRPCFHQNTHSPGVTVRIVGLLAGRFAYLSIEGSPVDRRFTYPGWGLVSG